jgi:hypothetical protein
MKDQHKGSTCAILGGGPSLVEDIQNLPEVNKLFGVNQHTMILNLDYLVFIDTKLWAHVKTCNTTFITRILPEDTDDKEFIQVRQMQNHNYSGAMAIWAADKMGFDKVYCCGMDQYDNADKLWWWQGPQLENEEIRKQRARVVDTEPMIKFLKSLRNPQKVFFMSGRLKELHQ